MYVAFQLSKCYFHVSPVNSLNIFRIFIKSHKYALEMLNLTKMLNLISLQSKKCIIVD